MKPEDKKSIIKIEDGVWYYFTVDLNFEGFASFRFIRYIDVNNDRKAALVQFLDKDYFETRKLLLLPDTRDKDYFKAKPSDILTVGTFDGSKVGNAETVDLKTNWPKNILDKAAITPSIEVAEYWTKNK